MKVAFTDDRGRRSKGTGGKVTAAQGHPRMELAVMAETIPPALYLEDGHRAPNQRASHERPTPNRLWSTNTGV